MDINQIITHLGEDRDNYFSAMAPPIIQSSNFVFPTIQSLRNAITSELDYHIYTRGNNPTIAILRRKIAALEKAEDALVVGSGAAAIAASVISNIQIGDHIICVQKPYSWTYKLLKNFLTRFGVDHTFVDGRDIENIIKEKKANTKLLYLESPNSLTFELQDIELCAKWARKEQIITIIDNSHCSPIYQNPIELGIDIVVHSATKYINGHSDVVAGIICSSKTMIKKIFESEFMTLGLTISPHDASLILRGLRTLVIRAEKSNQSANLIAENLFNHPKIKQLYYPFHPSFEQYSLAKKQMKGCGGLISFVLDVDNKADVYKFVESISNFLIAVSWGGYESLIMPSITFHDVPGQEDSPIDWRTVRIYVGIEDADFLWNDLKKALDKLL